MRLNQLPGYGLPDLAFWPQPLYETDRWQMYSLKLRPDGTVHWFRRHLERGIPSHAYADIYENYEDARKSACEMNNNIEFDIDKLPLTLPEKESLRLKVDKALTAKKRLIDEEQIMLKEAVKKHANDPRISADELLLNPRLENLRKLLHNALNEMPYLQGVFFHQYHVFLYHVKDNIWEQSNLTRSRAAKIYYQERIARGFGLSGNEHWGKTKAAIRSMLLPRANKLLQEASVKRMLDEAIRNGKKVLVLGNYVFWYEDKDQVGWSVKEINDNDVNSRGNIIWKAGTILSKNHGRIVVLPYTKENGEHVKGYTKNAPNDGNALPRHKNEYVELPFEILDGDLMFSLFGELKYE
ncbi:hypothetical protein AG06_002957 [Salmonella enterica subsp. enterica]|uniref:Uncharacterized protein n=2 Tax=Salmonella enterica TaxID=28901 RepID=A0A754E0W5_SALER|nr:hypothetical protein [Salmonella enterica]EAA5958520.1 hypothetical protein [Salmonella enterica subsp. enterica serovar Stanleyville]ECF6914082.1 hypothetical protein [Salmonella enterica subsp. enterica]EAA3138568.1 hypothetical protein [Salmonella enterica subsp. enterica serovar Bispebjerg]EBS5921281.1 hypothetical protein [Salmonella enterica subsp. enterica serovar Bispebjerg]EBX0279650.1 hypothetical protein [Salmonella enterica subsp. enterica serovar Bispebjerg]